MISIVNGYVCTTGCEEAKARQGKDPHAPPGTPPGQTADEASGFDRSATILDGVLKDLRNGKSVTPVGAASASSGTTLQAVNLLV